MSNRIQSLLPADPPVQTPGHVPVSRRAWIWLGVGFALLGAVAVLWISRARAADELHNLVAQIADGHGLDPALVEAVVRAESGGNPRAVSPRQAYGLMQLRIPTASEMARRPVTSEDLFDPRLNVELGCRYLRQMLTQFGGDERLALMAYNAGPGNVRKWLRLTEDPEEILKKHAFGQTRAYVRKVLRWRDEA